MNKILITSILTLSITTFAQDSVKTIDSTNDTTTKRIAQGNATSQKVLIGGRSKKSILKVVMTKVTEMRNIYNKRLKDKPGLKGKITFKFAINEFGKVVYCKLLESTVKDVLLEYDISEEIMKWIFPKIDKPSDITEVVYPFVFEPGSTSNKFEIAMILSLIISLCIFLPLIILIQIQK